MLRGSLAPCSGVIEVRSWFSSYLLGITPFRAYGLSEVPAVGKTGPGVRSESRLSVAGAVAVAAAVAGAVQPEPSFRGCGCAACGGMSAAAGPSARGFVIGALPSPEQRRPGAALVPRSVQRRDDSGALAGPVGKRSALDSGAISLRLHDVQIAPDVLRGRKPSIFSIR